jgi:hypothetical protein
MRRLVLKRFMVAVESQVGGEWAVEVGLEMTRMRQGSPLSDWAANLRVFLVMALVASLFCPFARFDRTERKQVKSSIITWFSAVGRMVFIRSVVWREQMKAFNDVPDRLNLLDDVGGLKS